MKVHEPSGRHIVEIVELGGSRRTLTPGDYLLVEKIKGEWPKAVALPIIVAVRDHTWGTIVSAVLDALSDHTEGEDVVAPHV